MTGNKHFKLTYHIYIEQLKIIRYNYFVIIFIIICEVFVSYSVNNSFSNNNNKYYGESFSSVGKNHSTSLNQPSIEGKLSRNSHSTSNSTLNQEYKKESFFDEDFSCHSEEGWDLNIYTKIYKNSSKLTDREFKKENKDGFNNFDIYALTSSDILPRELLENTKNRRTPEEIKTIGVTAINPDLLTNNTNRINNKNKIEKTNEIFNKSIKLEDNFNSHSKEKEDVEVIPKKMRKSIKIKKDLNTDSNSLKHKDKTKNKEKVKK